MKSKPFHAPAPASVWFVFEVCGTICLRRAKTSHSIPQASSNPSAVAPFVIITDRTGRQ
jgi:hypothetical protein